MPESYINALCNEISFRLKEQNNKNTIIKTIYFGGGTPSLLNEKQINKITSTIKAFDISPDCEFTFEVNPDDVTVELLRTLEAGGVNRLSVGLQSFSDTVLKSIHRRADSTINEAALSLILENWKGIISADLICALPYETKTTMLEGLKKLVDNKVPHISFYSLCVEEETPLGKKILNNTIDYDQDFADSLWLEGRNFLLKSGYIEYEVSNFCLKGYECLHNMTYWTHQSYLGFGAGAAGTMYNKDGSALRTTNTTELEKYISFWDRDFSADNEWQSQAAPVISENITVETSQFEFFMMGLRLLQGVSLKHYKKLFGATVPQKVLKIFQKLEKKGLCVIKKASGQKEEDIILTTQGMLFLNQILVELFNMES